jgi:hypothetical protein
MAKYSFPGAITAEKLTDFLNSYKEGKLKV